MLNSISELHSYIDKTQLTEELGGTLEYCHTQWFGHQTVSSPSSFPPKKILDVQIEALKATTWNTIAVLFLAQQASLAELSQISCPDTC